MDLNNEMKKAFANSFAFYLKAQYYHWNVEGPWFPMYHDFFGGIYQEVYGSIDAFAEQIRTLNAYAPGSFKRLEDLSDIKGEERVELSYEIMIDSLLSDNYTVLNSLKKVNDAAEEAKNLGLIDFIGARIDAHNKHAWMLRSTAKMTQ